MPEKKSPHPLPADGLRMLDANFNRAKEGLRVCEDIARFHLKSGPLMKKISSIRHDIGRVFVHPLIDRRHLFDSRDVAGDEGKTCCLGPRRRSFEDIFMANAQRVKEALRVLEELTKLIDPHISSDIQKLRFRFYGLEKESVKKFPALLDPR
jgi:hypothetical protein